MSIDSEYKKIREAAHVERVTPPESAWPRIQQKLNQKSEKTTGWISARLILSIAASFIFLFMCLHIVDLNRSNRADLMQGKIVEWENLESVSDYFYSVQDVRSLSHSYKLKEESMIN